MASQHPHRNAPSGWGDYLSALRFWQRQGQHQDQHGQFRDTSVDPESEPPILENVSSMSVKVDLKVELGKGAFATVYAGHLLDKNEECAIKIFNDKVLAEDVEKELKRMYELKHPNIVRVYGMIPAYKVKGRNAFVIVMELCDMSLDQYIKERFKKGIFKIKMLQILHDIASAMVYLHSQDMVHGDLRSPNVLVKEFGDIISAKITDFGMTGCLNEAGELMTTMFADAKYLPPEVFMNNMPGCTKNWVKLSRKVDVFSYGPIAIELGCGEFPEPTAKAETKKKKVVRTFSEIQRRDKHIKKVKRVYSECIELIVKQCMQDRPEERASFSEILLTVEGFQHQCSTRPDSEWIDEKQHEIEQLRAQMEADQQAKEEYKRCNHLKWEEMESKQKTLEQNAEELKRLLGVKEQAMHELTEKARKQSEELETVQFTNMALKREVEDLHKLNAEANNKAQKVLIEKGQKLQVLEEQNRTLSQERDNFYEDCVSNNTKIQELEQKILEKDSQMEVLSHKKDMLISKLEIQCQDLHSEIEQKQKQFSERENGLKREVEEANSDLEERKRTVETLKNQLEKGGDVTAVTQQYEEQKRMLEESFKHKEKSLQHKIECITLEEKRQAEEAKRIQKMNNLLAEERDQLVTEREEMNSRLTKLEAENFQLQSEQKSLTTDTSSLRGKYDKLETERDHLNNERDKLSSRLTKLEAENFQLQSEQKSLTTDKDSLQGKYDKLEVERDHLKKEIGHLKEELDRVKGEKETIGAHQKTLEGKSVQLKNDMQVLEAERDTLKNERDALMTAKDDLKIEGDNLKAARDALEAERNTILVEKKQLEDENRKTMQTVTAEKKQLKDEIKQARAFIVQWLKNDRSKNEAVDVKSSLKDLLHNMYETHNKEVRHLKEEGEASLKLVADEYAVNWQTALEEQQEKDTKIQKLQRLSQEKETQIQKLTQELSQSKEEYRALQSSWQKLSNKKAALEKKMKVTFEKGKEAQEDKNSGERAEEELKRRKDELANLHDKCNTLQREKANLTTSLQTKQNSLNEKTKEYEREHKFAIEQQKKVNEREEKIKYLQEQLRITKTGFKARRVCLLNSVSKIQRIFDHMHNEVVTAVTCRLENLELKLEKQHMALLEKLRESESVIAKNKFLEATCKECEKRNSLLHKKLTVAKCKEEELTKAWKEECSTLKQELSHCEERLGRSNKELQGKNETIDGLVKSIQEKDALCNETKTKLSNANAHSEYLEEKNKELRSNVGFCWGRISELEEDKKLQHSELLDCQEKCRMSEEQWNSKLAEKKMLIAFLATELGLVKEKVQNLQSQLEAAEVVHIVLLKCMENECTLKFKALQAKLTDSKNQCATLREMVSHKDCELQDVLEHLVAVKSSYDRSKTERDQYENQCATLREDISRKHLELQDLREDLVAFKSSYDRTKVKRDEYEDAQLVLQEKVQKLEQCNKRLEEMVCRDESHLMLLHEKDCLEAQLTTLKETHRKALSEKLELQIGHDSLIETLEQQTRRLEEEKKKLERIQRKQEKHFRDRCGKLIQGEVELKEGVQTLEVEKARFQERTKLYEAVKMSQKFEMEQERDELKRELEKLKQVHAKTLEELENCHMRLKEIEAELRKKDTECQTTSKAAAELRKMYAECQTTSEKLTKTQRSGEPLEGAYKNVKVNIKAHSIPTLREFLIAYNLFLRQPKWACDNVDNGLVVPEKQLSQLCEVGSFKCISIGSLFPKNYSTFDAAIHSECPRAVRDFVKCIRTLHKTDTSTPGSLVTEAGSACSFTFLRSTDKVYLCHLLIAIVPKMIVPDKMELEPDTLHCLVQMALHDNFGEEMQKAANIDNISKGVIYNPFWHGREPPEWSRDACESLPEKAKPVAGQLQLEAARKLDKLLKCLMDRIPID